MNSKNTAANLLQTAQGLIQERGFNAFSYADLAQSVGVRTASIHYHFRTKVDLVCAIVEQLLEALDVSLGRLDRQYDTQGARLRAFIDSYRQTHERGHICACGSLASDLQTLPEEVQKLVRAYIDRSEQWVREKIIDGTQSGEFRPGDEASNLASLLIASLQGALIIARARGGESVIDSIQQSFLEALTGPGERR